MRKAIQVIQVIDVFACFTKGNQWKGTPFEDPPPKWFWGESTRSETLTSQSPCCTWLVWKSISLLVALFAFPILLLGYRQLRYLDIVLCWSSSHSWWNPQQCQSDRIFCERRPLQVFCLYGCLSVFRRKLWPHRGFLPDELWWFCRFRTSNTFNSTSIPCPLSLLRLRMT